MLFNVSCLSALRNELGYREAPLLEQLLIQHAALCWLKLSLVELQYSYATKGSITLTVGMYWEKRLTAAQKRFTRACETLARVRKLARNTPALQVNIAANGGQQVNTGKPLAFPKGHAGAYLQVKSGSVHEPF